MKKWKLKERQKDKSLIFSVVHPYRLFMRKENAKNFYLQETVLNRTYLKQLFPIFYKQMLNSGKFSVKKVQDEYRLYAKCPLEELEEYIDSFIEQQNLINKLQNLEEQFLFLKIN